MSEFFPNDWDSKRLNELGESYSGLKSKTKADFIEEGNAKFVTYRNINKNYFVDENDLSPVVIEESENQNAVIKGDVLFTVSSETPEEVAFSSVMKNNIEDLYLNSFSFGYRFNNDYKVEPEFYAYYFRGNFFRKVVFPLAQGSTRYNISRNELLKLHIPIPPIKEQQKIAAILSSVDEVIEKTEQIIEQTETVKKGLMQELLKKGIGHTEYKNSSLGEIPQEWSVVSLSEVLNVQGGYAFKSIDSVNEGIPWFKIANVSIGQTKWDDKSFLPVNYSEIYDSYVLHAGDIVMAMTRPILSNETKVVKLEKSDVPALLNQRVGRFVIKDKKSRNYLYHIFRSKYFANEILLKIAGTDPPNVSSRQIESINIPFPGIEEQVKIAEILNSYDDKINIEKDRLNYLINLKKGLMQQLLTGKKRVKVDDSEEVLS